MTDISVDLNRPYLRLRKWAVAVDSSPSKVRGLLNAGRITGVKNGKDTLIKETPAQYLSTLPAYQPGTMPAGPGRGHKSTRTAALMTSEAAD